MRNLLIITQKVDENDDLLGFFVGWLREFSKRFDRVFVITLAKGEYELPANVFVYPLGKEKNNPKFVRTLRFYKFLFQLIPKSNGVFCHMSPIFAIMSWPITVIFRKRIILWYLHRSVTFRLRLAEKLVYKIATATKESLNLKSKKILELGHGIDVKRFRTERKWDSFISNQINILSVGRISKIKDYETLIRVAGTLRDRGLKFKIKIIGRPVMKDDFSYLDELKNLVKKFNLAEQIRFVGFIPYSQLPAYYKNNDIFVNLAPKGGLDKVVLEAMASGCITFVSNNAFEKYFGGFSSFLIFKHEDVTSLADKILNISKLPNEQAEKISTFLEGSVLMGHNLSDTISKISSLFNL